MFEEFDKFQFDELNKLNLVEDENKYYRVNEYDYLDRRSQWCGKILEAKKETIISRIDNDLIRDKNTREHQKHNVDGQMRYLNNKYPNAVRINTEDKTPEEIAGEILALL